MPPRSSVRTNIVLFTILGFVVALLIHFVVLSSPRYNWLEQTPEALFNLVPVAMAWLSCLSFL